MDSYWFRSQINRLAPIGVVAEGLRVNVGFSGPIGPEPLEGMTLEGTCYLLIRPDGVAVVDAREVVLGDDGVAASIQAGGYIVPPMELPELAVLAEPSFVWPDIDMSMHGWTRPQTSRPELAAMNRSVYAFTGTVNMATGALNVNATRIGLDVALARS